jgi:hypothetical protein
MKTLLLALSAAASLAVAAPALAHDFDASQFNRGDYGYGHDGYGYGRGDYGYGHDGYGYSRGDYGRDHRRGLDDRWSWRFGRRFDQRWRHHWYDEPRGDHADWYNHDRGWDRYQFHPYRGGYDEPGYDGR